MQTTYMQLLDIVGVQQVSTRTGNTFTLAFGTQAARDVLVEIGNLVLESEGNYELELNVVTDAIGPAVDKVGRGAGHQGCYHSGDAGRPDLCTQGPHGGGPVDPVRICWAG